MLGSCGPGGLGADRGTGDRAPAGVTATVELGYPRDLFERGRVNVVVSNDSDGDLVILDRELDIDGFASAGAQQRRSTVPGGARVALQTPFGEPTCADQRPITASMRITYHTGTDPAPRTAAIAIRGTEVLEGIRARVCTAQHVRDTLDIQIAGVTVDEERVEATAVLTRATGSSTYEISRIVGTVLIGAEVRDAVGAGPWVLPQGVGSLVLPLEFSVNRCDAHAVAETTRRFGLDLRMSVDGAPEQPVPVPLGDLTAALETILARCQARSASPVPPDQG